MGADWLRARLEDLADASGDNEFRTNLGRTGNTLLVDGRPESTGQGYEAPGFIETLVRAVGPCVAVGVAKIDGATGAAVGPLVGFDAVSRLSAGKYELTWPLPFYFDTSPQGFVQVNAPDDGSLVERSVQFVVAALGDGLVTKARVKAFTILAPATPTDADVSVVVWGALKRPPPL